MNTTFNILNELLVEIFNDILQIELSAFSEREEFSDLSITEIHTIEAIGTDFGKPMSEVAGKLRITVGTLTKAIDKLIRKGYVERGRIEEDRRVVLINLTNKGKIVYKVHEMFHKKMINETIEGLTKEEEEILVKALSKLNNFFKSKIDLSHV